MRRLALRRERPLDQSRLATAGVDEELKDAPQ